MTYASVCNVKMAVGRAEIMVAMNSEALSLGYCSLKREQTDIILYFIMGNDVFAVLPTGFGKSLCYACLHKTETW